MAPPTPAIVRLCNVAGAPARGAVGRCPAARKRALFRAFGGATNVCNARKADYCERSAIGTVGISCSFDTIASDMPHWGS